MDVRFRSIPVRVEQVSDTALHLATCTTHPEFRAFGPLWHVADECGVHAASAHDFDPHRVHNLRTYFDLKQRRAA